MEQQLVLLPSTALDVMIHNLNYDDIISMTKTPIMRTIILDYISYEANFTQFKKKIILDCIDTFEKELDTNLFLENIEFFIHHGYKEFYTLPSYQLILDEFYETLEKKCEFVPDHIKVQIQKYKKNKIEPQEIFWFFGRSHNISEIFEKFMLILSELNTEYENKLGKAEDEHITQFLKCFFQGHIGLENMLKYVSQLKHYIKLYITDEIDSSNAIIASNFLKKLEHRLNKIQIIFEINL